MKKTIAIIAVLAWVGSAAIAEDAKPLKIYVPRSIVTDDDPLNLASICVIRGEDSDLVAKVNAISIGRGAISGEQLTLDRSTIMARLSTVGIQTANVEFSGAEKVVVSRKELTVRAQRIIQEADAFLKKNYHPGEEYKLELAGQPKEMILPQNTEVELKVQMAKNSPANHVRVEVQACAGEKVLGKTEVTYKLIQAVTQLVAKEDIATGQPITPENTKVEKIDNSPQIAWVTSPYGMVASKPIKANVIIDPSMVAMPKIASIVKRNQTVTLKIARENFEVKAIAVAMQDGKTGEIIKVKNADSNRIVSARVIDENTVEPFFEEEKK